MIRDMINALRLVSVLALVGACGAEPPITDCSPAAGIEPICGLRGPEDLLIAPGRQWLIMSQYVGSEPNATSGSLVALRRPNGPAVHLFPPIHGRTDWFKRVRAQWGSPKCPGPPLKGFAPHGLDLRKRSGTNTFMVVVNHAGREAIEIFELGVPREGSPVVHWRGCVPLPPGTTGNDVAILPEGGFVVTHMFEPGGSRQGLWNLVKGFFGANTGYVLEWKPERGWRKVPGTDERLPNGVIASPDGKYIWFSAWLGNRVVRATLDGSEEPIHVDVTHPDNLTWADDGRILVASQDFSISEALACSDLEEGTCGAPFSIIAIDPETFETETLVEQQGAPMGAGTVGLQVDGDLYIGSFTGDRMGRIPDLFTESASP